MIALVSHGDDGMRDWKALTFPNKQAYCYEHGYDCILSHDSYTHRPPAWYKIPLLLSEMQGRDWLFWSDPDSVIVDTGRKLEEFISDDYDFIVGQHRGTINTGQFFVKNSKVGRMILEDIYKQTQFLNHVWWENMAFIHLVRKVYGWDVLSRIKIEEQAAYNRFPDNGKGSFIIHFAGAYKNLNQAKKLL
jgi:hypothetical protein